VAKTKKLNLKDAVFVEDEPRKPVRVITQEQACDRLKITVPTLLKYEGKEGGIPRARTICGKTVYIEHEFEECIKNAPFRKLKGDAE